MLGEVRLISTQVDDVEVILDETATQTVELDLSTPPEVELDLSPVPDSSEVLGEADIKQIAEYVKAGHQRRMAAFKEKTKVAATEAAQRIVDYNRGKFTEKLKDE